MTASELISDLVPALMTSDTGEDALKLMSDYQTKHLPIVNNKQFLGLISEEDIFNQDIFNEPVGSLQLSYYKPFVPETAHIYEVLKVAAALKLTLIPVVDESNNYKGAITLEKILFEFAKINSITDAGGILALETNVRDYSLSEISRIAESNNARILSLYTSIPEDSTKVHITIKINKEDIRDIISSFERFGYGVLGYFHKSSFEEDLKDRYDSFIKYLNI